MQVYSKALGVSELRSLLSEDPLRKLKDRKKFEEMSEAVFFKKIDRLIFCSRYYPRLAERAVELLCLYSEKISYDVFSKHILNCPWSASWSVLIDFARKLNSKNLYLKGMWNLSKSYLQDKSYESFYWGLYPFSPRLAEKIWKKNHPIWQRHMFWAQSTPYSKELQRYFSSNRLRQSNSEYIKAEIKNLSNLEIGKRWTLLELENSLNSGLSSRQLLRLVKASQCFDIIGEKKARRYRSVGAA